MPGEPITRRGRASRERIVERAAELFAERGITATTVDDVLAAAGAGKGQFYHYFRGRDELAAAAVGFRCAQVVAGLSEALGGVSSLAGLEQALAGFVAGFEQAGMPGCPIGTLATEVAGRNEDARLQAAAGFDAWERLLADALERMRERGELRTEASPAALATGLLASIEGGMVLSQARKDMASLRVAVEAGLAQVRSFLSLLCTKSSSSCQPQYCTNSSSPGGFQVADCIAYGAVKGGVGVDHRLEAGDRDLGFPAPAATAAHLALVWGAEQVMLPALRVAPPAPQWGAKELAVDGWHHLVYAGVTAAAYELPGHAR